MSYTPVAVADRDSRAPLPRSVATGRRRALLAAIALGISVAVLAALALAAGWHATFHRFERARWPLLAAVIAAHLVAYSGYTLAHHRALNLRRGRPLLWRETAIVLVVGFGAVPAKGGFGVDRAALVGLGTSREEATICSISLAVLEFAILIPAAWVCSLLLIGARGVPESETLPWAILVPLLAIPALAAIVHVARRRDEPQADRRGWIRKALETIAQTLELVRHPFQGAPILGGIALYSAADICALAMALWLCHVHLAVDRLILAYATGYVVTRRTLPLAGAGVTEALLCLSLTWVGLPIQVAIPGVLVYRLSDLALTLLPALASSGAFIRLAGLGPYAASAPILPT